MMKKPKIIPAFINHLTYNEKKYLQYTTLGAIIIGVYFTWIIGITLPGMGESKHWNDQFAWKIWGMFPISVIMVTNYFKIRQYRKLIKLEPKVKQTKDDSQL